MNLFRRLFSGKKEKKIDLKFPTSWEMVDAEQFRKICVILSLPGIGREQALFLCLCALTDIRPDNPDKYDPKKITGLQPFIINGQTHLVKAADIAAACGQIAFVYDTIGLTPSPFKEVDRMLYGKSFRQFFTADSYILRYGSDPNPAYLKEAAKVLTDGRVRKLLDWQRKAMVIWWNGLKDWMRMKYPYVFQPSEGSIGISGKTQAEILQDLLSCMNDNKPQENEKILKTEVHQVLYSLNKIYEAHVNKRVPQ